MAVRSSKAKADTQTCAETLTNWRACSLILAQRFNMFNTRANCGPFDYRVHASFEIPHDCRCVRPWDVKRNEGNLRHLCLCSLR